MSYVYNNSVESLTGLNASRTGNGGRRAIDQVLSGERQAVPYGIRLLFYIISSLLFMQSLVILLQYKDTATLFSENGILEWLQIALLMLCVILLNISARMMMEMREVVYLLSFMPIIAIVRELDHIFDNYVFDGAWQVIVLGVLAYVIYLSYLQKNILQRQITRMLALPSTGLLFGGFLTVMVFSRVFGQQSFWQLALQENYFRMIARVVEEGAELFGYYLLVLGCIELLIFALSCRVNNNKP